MSLKKLNGGNEKLFGFNGIPQNSGSPTWKKFTCEMLFEQKSSARKKLSSALLGVLISSIFIATASAQSVRRGLTSARLVSPNAPSPSIVAYEATRPQKDIDLFVGRIVRKDGDSVIVYVMAPSKITGRSTIYYACDEKMRPTAVLKNAGIANKACAAFKVESGTALVGDVVMIKYLAPKKEEEATKDAQ